MARVFREELNVATVVTGKRPSWYTGDVTCPYDPEPQANRSILWILAHGYNLIRAFSAYVARSRYTLSQKLAASLDNPQDFINPREQVLSPRQTLI